MEKQLQTVIVILSELLVEIVSKECSIAERIRKNE